MSQNNANTEVVGQLFRLNNTDKPKFSNQKDNYAAVWVEDGGVKKCLMFTDRELKIAENRSKIRQKIYQS